MHRNATSALVLAHFAAFSSPHHFFFHWFSFPKGFCRVASPGKIDAVKVSIYVYSLLENVGDT